MNWSHLLRINICIDCTPIWNNLPVNHTFKIPSDTHYFGAKLNFFNNGFGRLAGTEPLFRGFRFGVINPFLITCDNSPDKYIIYEITNKLTDIHSMLSLLSCQFMRYRSTAYVWFSKLPECGKFLVFSSPVLKCWNHCRTTLSLTTPIPTTHILWAAAAAL